MEKYLELLNDKQREACMDTEGPSLIIAGAGSGKTKVLTSRIAYLINEKNVSPENILAITFTNKAAKEMQDRLDKLIEMDHKSLTTKTFHSFCALFLRKEIGILKERTIYFQIVDDDDSEALIKEAMLNLNMDTKLIKPKAVQTNISLIKSKVKDLSEFNDFQREKIEMIMNEYNKLLIKNNRVDFDDLIELTLRILKKHKDVLERYQEKFKYILVDEFQDTSNIQYELVELLASKYENIFIVGDEDQSIYSFRGANIKNIRKFMTRFKNHHKHILDENYRSTKKILDTANTLIENNKERIKKDLWTSSKLEGEVTLYRFDNDKEESRSVIEAIKRKAKEGYSYKDFAILYRNNFLSRNFENELIASRIPYRIYSGISFYKRKEVKDMIAYLSLIVNVNDFCSFKRVINSPKRGIGDTTLSKIESIYLESESLLDAIDKSDISAKARTVIENFINIIFSLRNDFEKYSLKDYFYQVYTRTGYKSFIDEIEDDEEKMSRALNIQELMNAIGEAESLGSVEETLSDFLQNIALLTDFDIESKDDNHVALITMHSAKGLEFRHVFVVGLEEDTIPGQHAMHMDEIEEERRLLYVALTRAKENLYISCALSRYKYGQVNVSRSSRFLNELNLDEKPRFEKRDNGFLNTLSREKKEVKVGKFKVGDRVKHEMYGVGTISAQVEGFYIIKFDDSINPKKVIVDHPFLKEL